MSVPANREEFREWCLRRLGKNVIEINVDPDQVEDRIDEALAYWRTFHSDAIQKTYLKHQITQTDIDNGYISANNDVLAVNRIFPVNSSSGMGRMNMFDFQYQMRLNDFGTFYITQNHLIDYYMVKRHLEQIDFLFTGEKSIRFNRHSGRIYLDLNWERDVQAGEYIILECSVILDEDVYTSIWSDRMLQLYCCALIKMQWGYNLKKINQVVLLGGITLSGQEMYNEAMNEIKELEQQIRNEFEEPPMFITG